MKYSVLGTSGALVGTHSAGATDDADETAAPASTPIEGLMFPYQFTPGAQFTVVERDLDWRPNGLADAYQGHVIEYDHARSLRAFLFTDSDLSPSGGDADDDASEQSLQFGSTRRPESGASNRVVGVDVEL